MRCISCSDTNYPTNYEVGLPTLVLYFSNQFISIYIYIYFADFFLLHIIRRYLNLTKVLFFSRKLIYKENIQVGNPVTFKDSSLLLNVKTRHLRTPSISEQIQVQFLRDFFFFFFLHKLRFLSKQSFFSVKCCKILFKNLNYADRPQFRKFL